MGMKLLTGSKVNHQMQLSILFGRDYFVSRCSFFHTLSLLYFTLPHCLLIVAYTQLFRLYSLASVNLPPWFFKIDQVADSGDNRNTFHKFLLTTAAEVISP
jgi:hypothetical protein